MPTKRIEPVIKTGFKRQLTDPGPNGYPFMCVEHIDGFIYAWPFGTYKQRYLLDIVKAWEYAEHNPRPEGGPSPGKRQPKVGPVSRRDLRAKPGLGYPFMRVMYEDGILYAWPHGSKGKVRALNILKAWESAACASIDFDPRPPKRR